MNIYPPYTNGLVVHANSPILEKKRFFCLVVRGVYPPYTLSGPTTKKPTFLMCVFPKFACMFLVRLYSNDTLGIY